jgi:hypothetical protein
VRASRRFAIGVVAAVLAGRGKGFAAGGKAVMVCDVEVMEDVVLLALAIVALWAADVSEVDFFLKALFGDNSCRELVIIT